MRLSYSAIDTYLRCPLQYKFRYIERLPMKPTPQLSFGSTIHTVLKEFYRDRTAPPPVEKIVDLLDCAWEDAGFTSVEEETEYRARAIRVLETFWEKHRTDYRCPEAVEEFFEIPLDGVTLTGVIDRVDRTSDGGLEVIDYKTSERIPSERQVQKDLQLSIYHFAAHSVYGEEPSHVTLYFVVPDVIVRSSRSESDTQQTLRTVFDTVAKIKEKRFEPKKNRLCPWCDHQDRCPFFSAVQVLTLPLEDESPQDATGDAVVGVDQLITEYVGLLEERRRVNDAISEIEGQILTAMEDRRIDTLCSGGHRVERKTSSIIDFDPHELRALLEPHDLWNDIVSVDPSALRNLLTKHDLSPELADALRKIRLREERRHTLRYQRDS